MYVYFCINSPVGTCIFQHDGKIIFHKSILPPELFLAFNTSKCPLASCFYPSTHRSMLDRDKHYIEENCCMCLQGSFLMNYGNIREMDLLKIDTVKMLLHVREYYCKSFQNAGMCLFIFKMLVITL